MGLPVIFLTILLLLQSAFSLTEDSFDGLNPFNSEDDWDIESYLDRQTRNGDKFLRFGKAYGDYDSGNDLPYDDRDVQRPSRIGRQEKNDQFIRFGRSKQEFLRPAGIHQQRTPRDKSSFLRFGRSLYEDSKKKREKRDTVSTSEALKRHENYLRFGRNSNSNFMRFGRNLGVGSALNHGYDEDITKQNFDLRNKHMLNYLKNLLRQSEENRHTNKI